MFKKALLIISVALPLWGLPAYAASLGDVASNLFVSVQGIKSIMDVLCYMTGGGLLLGSVFRFIKYRKNPIEAPLSSVFVLFVTGLIIVLLPFIPIPTPQ
jgi:hypothetical protein